MEELRHTEDQPPLETVSRGPTNLQVEQELSSILASSVFRTSKQSQRLLQYLVDQTLQGNDEMLKERIVGAHVFGKKADYNTGDDPIVRVRASDLRKRLAQYYTAEGLEDRLRIELHPGSYHPIFVFSRHESIDPAEHELLDKARETADTLLQSASVVTTPRTLTSGRTAAIQQPNGLFRRHLIAIGAALCLVVLTVAGLTLRMHRTAEDMFWQPVLKSPQPALIYFGTDAVYSLSNEFLDTYSSSRHVEQQGREFFVDLPPGSKIDAKDLIPANDRVMVNDFVAATEVITFLNQHGKQFDVRSGRDISPGDLRHAPVILIGGFSNYLTLEVTNQLRFQFVGGNQIKDRAHPKVSWSVVRDAKGNCLDDYAIVSRLVHPESGATAISAAGIGPDGTQAAGEFLNNPQRIADAVKGLPQNWDQRDLQILLHIKGGGGVPNSVRVESVYLR